ncbi:hypothetical protein EG68_05366 [Paragonimus skrjabini miyazakii]|uniref:Dynein light chain n=1 Tax=Paragonimus skrjabini miyazakii TaxID=59628 RepID=A0A8S9YR95_9TREM|nr:hypothetical protein EG68_05366 [Paragonimus skrjabini miyazakii]
MQVNSSPELDSETAFIEVNEMPVGMQADAVRFTVDAMNKNHDKGIVAAYVKRVFDKTYEPSWHCVVGRNFGSCVGHEGRSFTYFYLRENGVLLFKCG